MIDNLYGKKQTIIAIIDNNFNQRLNQVSSRVD